MAENLVRLPLGAYGGLGLVSPLYLRRHDIIFAQFRQSVKPPFFLAAMRVRISISVWHPRLSTLRTMHGCLYEADSVLLMCVPLRAVKTMLAKTTKVIMTTNKLNFSTFIPLPSHMCIRWPYPMIFCPARAAFDLIKAVRIPKLQKSSKISKKLSLTIFGLI